jgi:hypothetical protein
VYRNCIDLLYVNQTNSKEVHFSNIVYTNSFKATLQRTNAENSIQIIPEKEVRGHSPNFHIYVSVSDLYIPTIDLPILLLEIYKSLTVGGFNFILFLEFR